MKRVRNLLAIAIPSMFIGGLMFGDNHSRAAADTGELIGYWPAASDVAGTTVAQRAKRVPSVPSVPPVPPVPPTGRRYGGGGVSVKINGNQIQIEGIDNLVNAHLEAVRQMLRTNPNIPKDMRDRITARMDRVKSIVDKHLKNVKTTDLDQLGDEMEKMGEELEKAMDGLDADIAQLGKDFGKDFGKKIAKSFKRDKWASPDPDDTDTDTDTDDTDTDTADTADSDDDLRDSIGDLKDMALKPAQKDAIVKLRTDSDARVAAEKKQLDDASKRLETALSDPRTSDADIARYVDQISSHEASIRKARLIAWVNARRVLDPDQVRKIENAAAKKKTQP